jgi:hypothetical protein
MQVKLRNKLNAYSVALFMYAILIVDLVRKVNSIFGTGYNVTIIRNDIYIISAFLIYYQTVKTKTTIRKIFTKVVVLSFVYLFSFALNPAYPEVYINGYELFLFRLFPAYLVGRYLVDWDINLKAIAMCSWIGTIYAVIAMLFPEVSSEAYGTLSQNLLCPALLALYYCIKNKKWILTPFSLICWLPMLLYGTRAVFVGIFLSVALFIVFVISQLKSDRKFALIFFSVVVVFSAILSFDSIISNVGGTFGDSRTVNMIAKGNFLDDSERSGYYARGINLLEHEPLNMHGLLGDYIVHANATHNINSIDLIMSSFSHNVFLEICLDFGLIIGLFLVIYFLKSLISAFNIYRYYCFENIRIVFVLILGPVFVNMMVSSSFGSDYWVWLLLGFVFYAKNFHRAQNYV